MYSGKIAGPPGGGGIKFNYLYYVCFSGVKESSKTEDCFSHLQEEYKYVTPEKIKGRSVLML
jgi:hypothetical protein